MRAQGNRSNSWYELERSRFFFRIYRAEVMLDYRQAITHSIPATGPSPSPAPLSETPGAQPGVSYFRGPRLLHRHPQNRPQLLRRNPPRIRKIDLMVNAGEREPVVLGKRLHARHRGSLVRVRAGVEHLHTH